MYRDRFDWLRYLNPNPTEKPTMSKPCVCGDRDCYACGPATPAPHYATAYGAFQVERTFSQILAHAWTAAEAEALAADFRRKWPGMGVKVRPIGMVADGAGVWHPLAR